jgi:hypothetical protein
MGGMAVVTALAAIPENPMAGVRAASAPACRMIRLVPCLRGSP